MSGTRTFKVFMHTVASATVPVRLRADELQNRADELGVEVGQLKLDDLDELIATKAHANTPRVCAQCSGWGSSSLDPSLELGDDWELDGEDAPRDRPIEDIIEITDER